MSSRKDSNQARARALRSSMIETSISKILKEPARRVGKGALAPCPPSFTGVLNGHAALAHPTRSIPADRNRCALVAGVAVNADADELADMLLPPPDEAQ